MKRKKPVLHGFTLIELLICLFIITIIVLLIIPNLKDQKHFIEDKGCEAYVKMIDTQIEAYELKENKDATLEELVKNGYVKTNAEGKVVCPANGEISIHADGSAQCSHQTNQKEESS